MNALKRTFSHLPIATVNGEPMKYWRDMASLWFLTTRDLAELAGKCLDTSAFLEFLKQPIDFVALSKTLKELLIQWRQLNDRSWGTILFWVWVYRSPVLEPVLPAIERYAIDRDVDAFKVVHHYLAFLYKAPTGNPALEDQALADYCKVEDNMLDEFPEDDIRALQEVLSEWCSSHEAMGLPNFGPGSTADAGPSLERKQEMLKEDELLRSFLPELCALFTDKDCSIADRISKTIFVPKTALSLRTISMEPAYLSFWQTPVEKRLRHILATSCAHCCDLTKQEESRRLALLASETQEYSTLDISAASDSISLALVEKIFPYTLVQRLVAVRSMWTELPDGRIIRLKKYAPMGSRITFPLETLIFCAVCEVATRRMGRFLAAGRTPYWVYGDDIIVLNEYAEEVVAILERIGFRLSDTKCFRRGCFYEACGVFALKGQDITTPCIPRNFSGLPSVGKPCKKGKPAQPGQYEQAIGLCNQFLLSGMWSARKFLMEKLPTHYIPFVEFQPDFLRPSKRDEDTRGEDPNGSKIHWSQGGLWTFETATNSHLEYRRVQIPAWEPPSRIAPDQSMGVLLLPGPSPRSQPTRPVWSMYEYKIMVLHTESYRERYSDEVRYQWKLRHPLAKPGMAVDIPSPPVGFGPRIRLRKEFKQL